MDVRMQEWLPPHHVPQNVEAEPTQWFPNWVLGGTPWAIKGTQASGAHPGFTRAICLSLFHTWGSTWDTVGKSQFRYEIFWLFKNLSFEIMSDFKTVNQRTFQWKHPHIL